MGNHKRQHGVEQTALPDAGIAVIQRLESLNHLWSGFFVVSVVGIRVVI